ncbi:MAG: trimethylamine methyltransferase family protein, partial [Candidatus Thorarchaeota archaeon]
MPTSVIDRLNIETWISGGSKDAHQRAKQVVSEHLENHEPIELSRDIEQQLDNTLKEILSKYNIPYNELPKA